MNTMVHLIVMPSVEEDTKQRRLKIYKINLCNGESGPALTAQCVKYAYNMHSMVGA